MATLITNSGRAIVTNRVTGLGGTAPTYVGIGSGSTAAAATDTALTTEYVTGTWSGYARVNVTPTRTTTSVANDTASFSATFTAPASETVAECGNFDASTSGNMFIHSVFTGVALSSGDSITCTLTYQLA